DLRTKKNCRGVIGGKEANLDVLTHLGQPLYQLDSVSTKTIMDNALKKIELQKDQEKKLISVFDNLESQWDVLKHNILKNVNNCVSQRK
ncbi:hypothetical protein MXB_1774, partial [Myxobolus squamalis]